MKSSYMLPSGTYNLILSKEDLCELLNKGRISYHIGHDIPCVTGRAIYDSNKKEMLVLDKKEIYNDLRFRLEEPVADIKEGFNNVQFLNIHIEKDTT